MLQIQDIQLGQVLQAANLTDSTENAQKKTSEKTIRDYRVKKTSNSPIRHIDSVIFWTVLQKIMAIGANENIITPLDFLSRTVKMVYITPQDDAGTNVDTVFQKLNDTKLPELVFVNFITKVFLTLGFITCAFLIRNNSR